MTFTKDENGKKYVLGEIRILIRAYLPEDDNREIIPDQLARSLLNNKLDDMSDQAIITEVKGGRIELFTD